MKKSKRKNSKAVKPASKRTRHNDDQLRCPSSDRSDLLLRPEILTIIFEHLSFEDLKNVRLTCELWEQCSKSTSVIRERKEKIVFRGHSNVPDDITEFLLKSNRASSIDFEGVDISVLPANIWEKCAGEIRHLRFHCCFLTEKSLKDIIFHCVNLESLEVRGTRLRNRGFISNRPSLKALDYFVKEKIERTALHTLVLRVESAPLLLLEDGPLIGVQLFRRIFAVFPRLEHFNSSPCGFGKQTINLKSSTPLKSVTYDCGDANVFSFEKLTMPLLWQFRLKKLELELSSWSWTLPGASSLFLFFREQKELEIIDLSMGRIGFWKSLTFEILKRCSKLREFGLICSWFSDPYTQLTSEEASQFFAFISKLQCLKLNGNIHLESLPTLSSDFALRTLSLKNYTTNDNFCVHILKHCKQLDHLTIFEPTDNLLQLVFETQPRLCVLNLYDAMFENFTLGGLTGLIQGIPEGSGFSIRKLERLQQLCVMSKVIFTREVVQELKLPQLKRLKLFVNLSKVSREDLCQIMLNLPNLETLAIDNRNTPMKVETITEFCSCLKKLRHFNFCCDESMGCIRNNCSQWQPLFEACPNLRYVSEKRNEQIFLYNPLTKGIVADNANNFDMIQY